MKEQLLSIHLSFFASILSILSILLISNLRPTRGEGRVT